MFSGAITAIVTPFRDNKVDYDAFEKLIEFQIEKGIHGIVPCGSTGESATMSHQEHEEVIKFAVEKVNKRVSVIAGTGSNNTAEAIKLTQYAEKIGADGSLLISPYYNKPTQEGLYQHYKAIAENSSIPLVLYNVPGRTSKNVEPETVARLAHDFKNIVAVKEASGDLSQMATIISLCPKDFNLISGDDALTFPIYAIGGKGVISVLSNIMPDTISELCNKCASGDWDKAREIYYSTLKLVDAMFIETNPIPVKEAVGKMGLCSAELRLPLTPMSKDNRKTLYNILKENKLI